jgi:very-short-patch-repair endonuclease
MSSDRIAYGIAARQGGAIRSDQALECGFTRGQIDQRVKDGRWRSIGRFGYRIIEMPGSMNILRAAVATLPNAVVSHDAAAELHGLPKLRRGVTSVMVHSRTTHVFPGAIVHRCHDLLDEHIVEVSDLPVTSIPRTIVDLAPALTRRHLTAVLAGAITEKNVRSQDVEKVIAQVARRGKPGIQKVRRVIEERSAGPRDGTPLERAGAEVLRSGGIREPLFEYPMPWNPRRRFDVAFVKECLAVEWDSRRWHELADAFERDRERDREALLHGWRVVRFTWVDVAHHPRDVVGTVDRLLEMSAAAVV